jgi:hypothetical protein
LYYPVPTAVQAGRTFLRRSLVLLAAVVALALASSANAAQFTFGTKTVGTSNNPLDADAKVVNLMSSPTAGTVVKVQGYLDGLGSASGSQKIKVVAYALSGGVPGALLGASNEVTIQHGQAAGWVTFTFPSSVSVPAGEVAFGYHRGGPTNRLIRAWADAATGTRKSNADSYSNGPSNPFGAVTNTTNAALAIKVTADAPTIYDVPEQRYGISPGFNALVRSSSMETGLELDQTEKVGSKIFRIDYLPVGNPWHAHAVEVINEAISYAQELDLCIGCSVNPGFRTVSEYAGDCTEAATTWHNKIRYFEVMNEPNTFSRGWTASGYEQYLAACYDAVKAVDSRNIVLLGGINPSDDPVGWVSGVYAAGGKTKFDRMNLHLYGDPTIQASYSFWCKTYGCGGIVFPSVVDVMNSNGDGSKPIVSTEGGERANVGESQQATVVSRYLADTRPFQAFVYNMLADSPGTSSDFGLVVQDASGTIIAPDGTHWRRRPSYGSARAAMGGTG